MTTSTLSKKQLSLIIGSLFFFFTVLLFGHDYFGTFIAETWDINDRPQFNALFDKLAIVLLVCFLVIVGFDLFKRKENRLKKVSYILFTSLFAFLSYRYLLVVHSEVIHFPQYAVVGFLLFLLIRNYPEALFAAILLGAVDEAYQYFSLAPEKTAYLDLNDMLLNAIGASFGLLIARATVADSNRPKANYFKITSFIPLSLILVGLLLAVLFSSGILAYQPEEVIDPKTYYLIRKPIQSFWSPQDFGVTYHIIRPVEGLIYLIVYWLIFFPMNNDRATKK